MESKGWLGGGSWARVNAEKVGIRNLLGVRGKGNAGERDLKEAWARVGGYMVVRLYRRFWEPEWTILKGGKWGEVMGEQRGGGNKQTRWVKI